MFGKVLLGLKVSISQFEEASEMPATDEFLLVKQAAELLGVSANTVRAWASTGKIQEYRHPVNNYRLFKRSDVEQLSDEIVNPKPVGKGRKAK